MVRTDVLPMVVAVHNALVVDARDRRTMSDVASIGDMKDLVVGVQTAGQHLLSAETSMARKAIAAAKVVGVLVLGVDGAKMLAVSDFLSGASSDDADPSQQQFVAAARVIAKGVDSFLDTDVASRVVAAVADAEASAG